MTNKIEQFFSEVFGEVRATKDEKGVIWFVAKDIADALNYASTQKLTDKIDDEDKDYRTWLTLGGEQNLVTINEGGVHQAIGTITKKDKERYAKSRDFKRWVTNEVLPTLRQTGGYVENNREDEFVNGYLKDLSSETKVIIIKELKAKNEKLQVKAGKFDKFMGTEDTYTFTTVAKMLSTQASEDAGKEIKISVQQLTKFLRDSGILSKTKSSKAYDNLPNNAYEKYFDVVSISVKDDFNKPQTRVKPIGIEFIYEKLIEDYIN